MSALLRALFRDRDVAPGNVPGDVLSFWRAKSLKVGFSYRDVWREEHDVAFTVAKVMRVDVLDALHQELDKAIAQGVPFDQWRRNVEPRLREMGWWEPHTVADPTTGKEAKVNPPARLRTIFDTNLRVARAAGQWDRIQRQAKSRPYLLYVHGTSARPRPQHLAWHGLLLPIEDNFWTFALPSNGYGCTCSVRSVSKREYESLESVPLQEPELDDDGNPTGRAIERRVEVRRTAPDVPLVPWENKRTGRIELVREGIDPGFQYLPSAQRQQIEVRLGRGEDPQRWHDGKYRALYGEDAGRAVAWGRAMEERGRSASMGEAKRRHVEITEDIAITLAAHPTPFFSRLRQLAEDGHVRDDHKTLGELVDDLRNAAAKNPALKPELHEARALAALIGHQAGIQPAGDAVKLSTPRYDAKAPAAIKELGTEILDKVRRFWSDLGDKSLTLPDKREGYVVRWAAERAHFDHAARIVYTSYAKDARGGVADTGFSTIVHEMGHGLEHLSERARTAAHEFLGRRTEKDPLRKMSEISANNGYADHEVTKEDKFFNPYMGKDYVSGSGKRYATEVTSMALEFLHRNASHLLETDEDTFYFALGQLAGDSAK